MTPKWYHKVVSNDKFEELLGCGEYMHYKKLTVSEFWHKDVDQVEFNKVLEELTPTIDPCPRLGTGPDTICVSELDPEFPDSTTYRTIFFDLTK